MSDETKWTFGRPGGDDDKPTIPGGFAEEDRTTRYTGDFADDVTRVASAVATGDADVPPNDVGPVVGWLVIVKGPGAGNSLNIGAGMNVVGRGDEASGRDSGPCRAAWLRRRDLQETQTCRRFRTRR